MVEEQLKKIASLYPPSVAEEEISRLQTWRTTETKNGKTIEIEAPKNVDVRLFSWQLSYFSGKIRSYLTYKSHTTKLRFDDINATSEVINSILYPATKTHLVPQLQLPNGSFLNDSSEIIEKVEEIFPSSHVIPFKNSPCQRLVVYIIELLADEWMIVPGYHWRWRYNWTKNGNMPKHLNYNRQQWGMFLNMSGTGKERARSGKFFFDVIQNDISKDLINLGCPEGNMADVWEQSMHGILKVLESHLDIHDYILGGSPSLADFALMGPLYAHMYRDPVSGFMLRTTYPLVSEWIERTVGLEGPNRSYKCKIYTLQNDKLVGKTMLSDRGTWLPDDEIPKTLIPLLQIFFEEMWPVLDSTIRVIKTYLRDTHGGPDHPLPFRSFQIDNKDQSPGGALTHEFELKGKKCRRAVFPYQIWMLDRIEKKCISLQPSRVLEEFLASIHKNGKDILELSNRLHGCQIVKKNGILYPAINDVASKL